MTEEWTAMLQRYMKERPQRQFERTEAKVRDESHPAHSCASFRHRGPLLLTMAVPLPTGANEIPSRVSEDLLVRQLMKSLTRHEPTFRAISEHPQAGIYRRHTDAWALCISYLESEVAKRQREVQQFCAAECGAKATVSEPTLSEPTLSDKLRGKMMLLFRDLKMHAQSFKFASEMSQAAIPTTLYADFFRAYLKAHGRIDGTSRAPNGEESSSYGEEGSPMSEEYTTFFPESFDPIEWLLINKMMNPFIRFFCKPFQKVAKKFKRGEDSTDVADQMVVEFGVISVVARFIVCMLAIVFLAAAIGALNITDGATLRIIVMSVIGMVFAFWVYFLGPDSVQVYFVVTAFFQVMVIFVGTTSDQKFSKRETLKCTYGQ